jgi:biotin synthase
MNEEQFRDRILQLAKRRDGEDGFLAELITCREEWITSFLYETAAEVRQQYYGRDIYIRGLIEISNYCRNDCYYCGIRKSNQKLKRYHLTEEEILLCCREGYALGFRTFVLQGGEDGFYTDERLCRIISEIKKEFPDCAVTLSLGEKSRESYESLYQAGADRYLLRHETADAEHYRMLHPKPQSLERRMDCLFALKEIGYQVGSGFMVGSPGQYPEYLIEDLRFLQKLQPAMIGIGPFLPHEDTPFRDDKKGDLTACLNLIAILRLLFPQALIPATTALGTLYSEGRELGILAGANVVMPNLSPASVRKLYSLYDNKACTGLEAAEYKAQLEKRMGKIGYRIVTDRGDAISFSSSDRQETTREEDLPQ